MSNNFLICQLSDIHFIDNNEKIAGRIDTAQQLNKALKFCNSLIPQPDIFIMSGDLIQDNPNFYKKFIELSKILRKPYYLMMGNHDNRNRLKQIIPNKNLIDPHGFINFSINEFPMRIIALDTVIENANEGIITVNTFNYI